MINIAQIGVGYWGPNLLRNLVMSKNCTVKTVVDFSKERRDYVQGLYPAVKVAADVKEVFQDAEIDAVVIATPVRTHFELSTRALKAGKHILVEKPLATSVAEVDQIGKIATEKNLLVMAGHTFLFNAAVRYAKTVIDSGSIGDVRFIYSQRLNLGRIRSDVDALWNLAPHDVSIIQYWLGDPEPVSVSKYGVAYIQEKIDDVVFMNIMYPNKVMANIHVSWLDPQKIRSMIIVGTKKMIIYDDMADNKIAIYDKGIERKVITKEQAAHDKQQFLSFDHRSGDVLLPKIDFKEPLKMEIEHFIDCVQNGTKCLTGLDHARKVVEILAGGVHSA